MVVRKKETVVRVIVEGPEDGKRHALLGLLKDANYDDIRNAVNKLSPSQVVRIAQVCHGRLYKLILD